MSDLRPLTPDDRPGYAALWADAVVNHPVFFRSTLADDPSGRIPTRFREDSFTLGAFDGDALVGVISVDRDRLVKLRHKAFISRMFVKPAVAGRGTGRALLGAAIRCAASVPSLRQLYLTVLDSNERAKALYRRAGFEQYAREPDAVCIDGEYVDECQMVLMLRREI